ncbi:MAG: Mini-ribonuclease 3 [Clostridia bacterium]|nr:Mini-ribonuclease 3 [Clostridia bacterium]
MKYANELTKSSQSGDLIEVVRLGLPIGEAIKDPTQLAPLSLAYIGDTVYDLFVRTMLLDSTTLTVHGLHQRAAKLVCAKAQAAAFRRIEPMLTESELSVFRRGRNAHIGTVPKSTSIMEYRTATGLEALIGCLYLSGENGRLGEIMKMILSDGHAPEAE